MTTVVSDWMLDVFVPGTPRPQGSKKSLGPRRMVESSIHVGPWRERVAWFSVQELADVSPIDRLIPVVTWVEFVMPRPSSAPKKSTPPAIRQPDLDKCLRAINDALTGIAWVDDAQVVDTRTSKRIAEIDEQSGVRIRVKAVA
jgi:crossover junction endodeoxyribonuclease RusA